MSRELTDLERIALVQALDQAVKTVTRPLYGEAMERWDREHPGDPLGFPAGHFLVELAALRHAAAELERFTDTAARGASAAGASYSDMGAVWGITEQAARTKWAGAVPKSPDTDSLR